MPLTDYNTFFCCILWRSWDNCCHPAPGKTYCHHRHTHNTRIPSLVCFVLYVIITASLNLFVYKCICDIFVMIAFNVARFLPGTISSNGFSKSIMATKNPWTQKFHQSPRHHRLKISSTISAIYWANPLGQVGDSLKTMSMVYKHC